MAARKKGADSAPAEGESSSSVADASEASQDDATGDGSTSPQGDEASDPAASCPRGLCNAKRPCSPECYARAGFKITDAEFLMQFDEPLRLPETEDEDGKPVAPPHRHARRKVRVVHGSIHADREYSVGEELKISADDADLFASRGLVEFVEG